MEATNLLFITLCAAALVPISTGSSKESREASSITMTPPIECVLPLMPGTRNHVDLICLAFGKQLNCGKLSLRSFAFNLVCNEGYISDGLSVYTLHINGSWTPRLPECKRWCKPLKSPSMDLRCEFEGKNIDCSQSAPIGTEATARCKAGYLPTEKAANSPILCRENGQWSHALVECETPACGRKNSTESVSPWVAMIYRCGSLECLGTLISPHIVLTTARCVYSERDRRLSYKETFEVIIGNLSKFSSHEQHEGQAIRVRQISVHPLYFGDDTNYAFNIGLMKLETSVLHVPACLDWDREFDVTSGQIGTVTGWTNLTLTDTQYEYMDYGSCVSGLKRGHRRYLTSDKFCNKHIAGKLFDTGSGLLFERNGVYFVKGVLHHNLFTLDGCGDCISFAMNLSDVALSHWLQQTKRSFDSVCDDTKLR